MSWCQRLRSDFQHIHAITAMTSAASAIGAPNTLKNITDMSLAKKPTTNTRQSQAISNQLHHWKARLQAEGVILNSD